uniref:Homer scaffold protein 2 n=1 Tax=Callithrix jacchus TaxID=9483 RepID=A0A2R8P9B4_CALJA
MLRLYRALGQVGAEPSTWGSARRPLAAEMPKKAGATTKGKSQSKEPERSLPPSGPVAVDPKGCVTIAIHAKPGSKQNAVTDLTAEAINVAIAAPPSEGEANAELCRYLSKVLELRKSDVVLDKTGSCYIAKAGPELLASSDLSTLASQSAGITGVSHTQLALLLISL